MFSPIMAQPTGHNPFRTTENNTNNMMLTIPQPSTSSILPTQQTTGAAGGSANPFRSNTMPQMSTSTPTLPYFNNSNTFSPTQTVPSMNMMQQQPMIQQLNTSTSTNTNNPFAMNSVAAALPSTIMVASPNTQVTAASNNPFNNATPKHQQQQLQPWGSSIF